MTAVAAKPAAGSAMNPAAMAVGVILLIILLGIAYVNLRVSASWP